MDQITGTQIFLASLGLVLRWLLHLHRSRIKNKLTFSWGKYFDGNWVLIIACIVSTTALLYLTSLVLEVLGATEDANNLISFAGGLMNLEVVEYFKTKVLDRLKPSKK